MVPDLFALTQDSDGRTERVRRFVVSIFLVVILLQPAARLFIGPRSGLEWFQLAGALTLTGIVLWQLTSARDSRLRTQQWLGLALALAIALFVVGGWLATGGLPWRWMLRSPGQSGRAPPTSSGTPARRMSPS
jgi:hypothetical protein